MVLGKVLSITCAGDPRQKCFWGILGAQVNDRRDCELPHNGVCRVLGIVLSITCAVNPLQKYLWGTLGVQVKPSYPHLRA